MYMWTSDLGRLILGTGDVVYQWCELKFYLVRPQSMSVPISNYNTGLLNCYTHIHIVNLVDGTKSCQEDGLIFIY